MKPARVVLQGCVVALFLNVAGSDVRSDRGQPASPDARQPVTADPARPALMRHHFALVMDVHDAVVRGDLETARTHARALADSPAPTGLPAAAGPYLTVMHRAASRASSQEELDDVASAAAAMVAACGDCHRAAGTMPAIPAPAAPVVGGTVGHMLDHKRAVDLMAQGLAVPSTTAWQNGVSALEAAPLRGRDLPRDSKLTDEIREIEDRVHELAERGREADDTRSRIHVYSELIQSCGECHSLHANVWGPGK
jgi:cytochrome c553